MEITKFIETVDREGGLLLDAARTTPLGTPVPSCPGWDLRDLVAHTGFVHRWAATYVGEGLTEMAPEAEEPEVLRSAPADDVLFEWFDEGHQLLVRALTAPENLDCWTFLPAPSPLAMWARRQAHETTVHRVDAEQTAGQPITPIAPHVAADGIDELLGPFLGRRAPEPGDDAVQGTLALDASDRPDSWIVQVFETGVRIRTGTTEWDQLVTATAGELYLLLWQRRPLAGLQVTGSTGPYAHLAELSRLTWS